MANGTPNTPVVDPDLDARFSNLNMSTSTPVPDGSLQQFPPAADPNASAFWSTQDTTLSSQPAALNYGTYQYASQDSNSLLAAQANGPTAVDYPYGTTDHSDQTYWALADDTSQAGPSSAAATTAIATKPFPCSKCDNSYDRKCDLEYVPLNPQSRRPLTESN